MKLMVRVRGSLYKAETWKVEEKILVVGGKSRKDILNRALKKAEALFNWAEEWEADLECSGVECALGLPCVHELDEGLTAYKPR